MAEVRLQKVIAAAGLASRREAEKMISGGRVVVNGVRVTKLGTKVDPKTDRVEVDGKPIGKANRPIYLMLNKPLSVVSSVVDPQGRKTIMEFLGDLGEIKGGKRVFHVGRLDYDTEGLILLTNDGILAAGLSHPSQQVPRVYQARVKGRPKMNDLKRLRKGVVLEDGMAAVIEIQPFKTNPKSTWLEVTVAEGRNRLVRRMLESIGCPVTRLKRVAYGGVELGNLKSGDTRSLSDSELSTLQSWLSGSGKMVKK